MHQVNVRLPAGDPTPARNGTPWTILVLLCVAQFMVILDVTVVNVALPSIRTALRFAPQDLQWVVSAYVLMTGGLLLLGGRMADLIGRRRVFLTGLVIFTGASLASGLAPTALALIASRAAQGLGAALLSPAALSIITTTYTNEQRTTALSVWGAIGAGGAAAGVLLGGVLTTWLGWRSVFFINVPVGLLAAVLAQRLVPTVRAAAHSISEVDLAGALTVVAGLVVLVYAVERTSIYGWASARTLVLLAISVGLLAAFAAIERRASRPLVPTGIWRVRSLISSATIMLGTTGILVGTFFLNSLLLQNVLGASALETGLAFLPLVVVIGIAAQVGPRLLTRVGARVVVIGGLVLIAAGDLLLSRAPANAAYAIDLLPGLLLLGFGVGLTFVALSVTAMSEIQAERAGFASGLMTTVHELGAAFGVAIFSAVALGSAAAGSAFVRGYGNGALAGALIAVVLALLAAAAIPTRRSQRLTSSQRAHQK
jgi:EmrB/QacA subfamily drug resistance transporter